MSDVVVTVPKHLWHEWIAEGDTAGEPESGMEWAFWLSIRPRPGFVGGFPTIAPSERVYVVAHGLLRGYAPLAVATRNPPALIRRGGSVALTIAEPIRGFVGWRYRWWDRSVERPFPNWKTAMPGESGTLFGPRP